MLDLLPPELSLNAAIGLIILSYFTSALTACVGVGGGIALISVMATFLPPAVVIPVHGMVQLGSNGGRAILMRRDVDRPMTLLFGIGAIVGVAAAAMVLVTLSAKTLQLTLGLFVLFAIWTPKLKPSNVPYPAYVVVGSVVTFCTMFVGATGPLLAAFLSPERLGRHGVVATAAICMAIQHILKVVVFGLLGFQFAPWLFVLLAMVVSGFLGTLSGRRVLNRIPERRFRAIFQTVITVLALRLIWAAFS